MIASISTGLRAFGSPVSRGQVLVNRGLLNFSKNEFVAAQGNFRNAAAAAAKGEPPDDNDGERKNAFSFV